MDKERVKVLLQAALELLEICDNSPVVLNAMSIEIRYDNANCDGYCLKEDIKYFLEEIRFSSDVNEL